MYFIVGQYYVIPCDNLCCVAAGHLLLLNEILFVGLDRETKGM